MSAVKPDQLTNIISRGESNTVEFKQRLPIGDLIAKDLVAFANTDGGLLLVGVKDDQEVVGLTHEDASKTISRLQKITESIFSFPIEINQLDIEGKLIVYAVTPKRPSYSEPITTSRGEIFKREGSVSVRISRSAELVEKIDRYLEKTNTTIFNVFVVMSFKEEEEPHLIDYYKAIQRAVVQQKLPFEVKKMDLIEGDYEISQQIMDEIKAADIVIVDYTMSSKNVYFEAGYARGCDKKIIQIARKDYADLEFDVKTWKTIIFRNATDLQEKIIPELIYNHEQLCKQ